MLPKRRAFIATLIFIILVLIPSAIIFYLANERFNSERIIFSMNDPKGDDYGPGKYKYPWAAIFDPKKEHFDLLKFRMLTLRDNYCFDMIFPRVTNPWGAPEGFSHPIIEIYLTDGSGQGRTEPLVQGSNVLFDPENPWKYMIKVVSFNRTAVYAASDIQESPGKTEGVKSELRPDKKTIRVSVPKKLLPGEPGKWQYYVLVGSQDGAGPDNFRVVNASASQWNFGGGNDTVYDPNIIDLLAPSGQQEKMLGSCSPNSKARAVISPVTGDPVETSGWENFLDNIINIFHRRE